MRDGIDIEWIYETNDMMSLLNPPPLITKLIITLNYWNQFNFTSFDLNPFHHLKSFLIVHNSLNHIVNIYPSQSQFFNEVLIRDYTLTQFNHPS